MWLFFGLPVIVFLIMGIIHASESIDSVRANWNAYRCNPIYMPFAGQIRPDIGVDVNFQYCMGMMSQDMFGFIVDAIMLLFKELTDSLGELTAPLNLFRNLFARMRAFVFSFGAQTFGKITNSMGSMSVILIKIRDILQRFVGSGYIGAFLANAGIDFVVSFVMACISVIKGFVYAILAISVLLALMGDLPMLILAITLASLIGASGF